MKHKEPPQIQKLGLGQQFVSLAALLFICLASPLRAESLPGTNHVPPTIHPLTAKGIENFFQLSDRFYSGSAPEGDEAFAALKKLGIKTIITVDGTKPDIDTAHRFGIRYVHLPIGYDGVPTNQAIRLVKAAETMPGPIYIHCHHGMHRGPAGAAVICRATEGWTAEQADSWLKLAGTATNYAGLYRTVAQFQPPNAETLKTVSANFPEKSDVSPLADVMIQIDERFDHLKLIKKAGYRVPTSHPDLVPAQEALLLNELFKEVLRSPVTGKHGKDFQSKLEEAESSSSALYTSLNTANTTAAISDAAFKRLSDSCAACHKAHRN